MPLFKSGFKCCARRDEDRRGDGSSWDSAHQIAAWPDSRVLCNATQNFQSTHAAGLTKNKMMTRFISSNLFLISTQTFIWDPMLAHERGWPVQGPKYDHWGRQSHFSEIWRYSDRLDHRLVWTVDKEALGICLYCPIELLTKSISTTVVETSWRWHVLYRHRRYIAVRYPMDWGLSRGTCVQLEYSIPNDWKVTNQSMPSPARNCTRFTAESDRYWNLFSKGSNICLRHEVFCVVMLKLIESS